ncbi:hypothetical protein C475_09574 [Halosimplex carlsbadense 2-9-1]|uniref:Uncharacterized protein n=1 Tax=Halosimplex carlsbadense 2-9-1 TaxID=797114 RepID=M0CSS2_9EURY|nr:DUF5797 family protein [Halosimplex carlsbadense]ELZ25698.1 hypothetical protein C475_09574 [Halosimplex carlsbadense 2-9-1]
MTLSDEARERLADVVALQPTKNAELQAQWDMDSGSDVHQYLESELKDYYYRDEDSLICATPEANSLVGDEVEGEIDEQTVTVPALQAATIDVLPDHDDEPQSVVATLHDLREAGRDPDVDEVRSALRSLAEKGVVDRVQKTVPTYRLAVERDALEVTRLDDEGD